MNKSILLILISLFWALNMKAQGNVSFVEEYIDFKIDQNYFAINGIYTFCNNGEQAVKQHILFPFAEKTSNINSIRVVNLHTLEKVNFAKHESAISFDFIIQPYDTVDINIFYRQKTSKTNKYIITTTKAWGKALTKAVYTLTTSPDIKIESFSYAPDSHTKKNNEIVYLWEKLNFDPTIDFEVIIR